MRVYCVPSRSVKSGSSILYKHQDANIKESFLDPKTSRKETKVRLWWNGSRKTRHPSKEAEEEVENHVIFCLVCFLCAFCVVVHVFIFKFFLLVAAHCVLRRVFAPKFSSRDSNTFRACKQVRAEMRETEMSTLLIQIRNKGIPVAKSNPIQSNPTNQKEANIFLPFKCRPCLISSILLHHHYHNIPLSHLTLHRLLSLSLSLHAAFLPLTHLLLSLHTHTPTNTTTTPDKFHNTLFPLGYIYNKQQHYQQPSSSCKVFTRF